MSLKHIKPQLVFFYFGEFNDVWDDMVLQNTTKHRKKDIQKEVLSLPQPHLFVKDRQQYAKTSLTESSFFKFWVQKKF